MSRNFVSRLGIAAEYRATLSLFVKYAFSPYQVCIPLSSASRAANVDFCFRGVADMNGLATGATGSRLTHSVQTAAHFAVVHNTALALRYASVSSST